jgi:hypothetical protein
MGLPSSPGGDVREFIGCHNPMSSGSRAVSSKLNHTFHSHLALDCRLNPLCVGFNLVWVKIPFNHVKHHSIFLLSLGSQATAGEFLLTRSKLYSNEFFLNFLLLGGL